MSFAAPLSQKKSQNLLSKKVHTRSCPDYPEPSGTVPTVRMFPS